MCLSIEKKKRLLPDRLLKMQGNVTKSVLTPPLVDAPSPVLLVVYHHYITTSSPVSYTPTHPKIRIPS